MMEINEIAEKAMQKRADRETKSQELSISISEIKEILTKILEKEIVIEKTEIPPFPVIPEYPEFPDFPSKIEVNTVDLKPIESVLENILKKEDSTPRLGVGQVFPSVGDVDNGITYGPTGADYTGTLEQPSEADVLTGVQYGAGGTEFTGSATGGGGGFISIINE